MTKSILRKYAKLIVQMGVNIKKGQGAVILADTAQSEIALMVAEEAYRAGAKWVDIRWTNQDLDKMRYKKESVKVLSATQEWEKARMQYELDELPVRIWIDSDDPDGLKGVNVEKMQKANLARMKVRKPYRDAMENTGFRRSNIYGTTDPFCLSQCLGNGTDQILFTLRHPF